jgi:competence protein ComEC
VIFDFLSHLLAGLVAVLLSLFGITADTYSSDYQKNSLALNSPLCVHYIDVGQGDSIYVKLPNGENLLIDAGDNGAGVNVTGYLKDLRVKKIDYLVATHPHSDHIGGMDDVINKFDIETMYMPDVTHNTSTFSSLLDAIEKNNVKLKVAKSGVSILKEENLSVDILSPDSKTYEDMNNYSAVVKITYGDTAFLFMGDAEKVIENKLKSGLKSDVIKVGHHGSDTSTGEKFLQRVSPEVAVISVGENNDYSHPHNEVVSRLKKHNIKIFRTDYDGTVVIGSDGEKIVY